MKLTYISGEFCQLALYLLHNLKNSFRDPNSFILRTENTFSLTDTHKYYCEMFCPI